MRIEVVYAGVDRQFMLELELPDTATVSDAVAAAKLQALCPELAVGEWVLGVWGQVEKSPQTRQLIAGDRVEIYRPLTIDPMAARKARADKVRQQRAKAGRD